MLASSHRTTFEVNVSNDTFKFNAAHFVAYTGFRERLHGHNYKLSVRLLGSRSIGQDGYVLDFGDVKAATKDVCKSLNEYFLCPMYSTAIQVKECVNDSGNETLRLFCEDGAEFIFPKADCAMLPIVHSTAEELAVFTWGKILLKLDPDYLLKRGIHTMEVTCAEATGQEAIFRHEIPKYSNPDTINAICDVRSYIIAGDVIVKPCLPIKNDKAAALNVDSNHTCPSCGAKSNVRQAN